MAKATESLAEFYKYKFEKSPKVIKDEPGQFNVFRIQDSLQPGQVSADYIRRDFYKIMLFEGSSVFHYGDMSIPVNGKTLLFFNPKVPYTSDPVTAQTKGYFCVFKDEFIRLNLRLNVGNLPMFSPGSRPVFSLDENQYLLVNNLFEKMINEFNSEYIYKQELIQAYVTELIFTAQKLTSSYTTAILNDANSRITKVFTELLDRQFPIDSTTRRFGFRSAKVIAQALSVHVNTLNRAIKQTTGRTTTDHINERLIGEAKALLRYTNLNISEISYMLGFENQAHFNKFFKKNTASAPSAFRKV
ncbi:AraC family transcriptional regulator [Dyadobacter luteus]|uniref:AraC family transcriptional regulator n=1 Tax=Dyadobacter luteus TaxID=2259619 RepID=A0A3D8YHZ7_9BACT|nr:helix-turn-helix domain-containing protein [Dyadobacter luteus]REA64456.1 AraC family transcriptional regulator [Dyadobacter luteus]